MGETKEQGDKHDERPAIEELREMVRAFDYCREDFLTDWTVGELLAIWRAWGACEWDLYPDQWSAQQAKEAAGLGKVPRFEENERGEVHALEVTDCRCGTCRYERTRVAPAEAEGWDAYEPNTYSGE